MAQQHTILEKPRELFSIKLQGNRNAEADIEILLYLIDKVATAGEVLNEKFKRAGF